MESKTRLGVIGCGNIGGAIAANLLADGFALWLSDPDSKRLDALVRDGAKTAKDAREIGRETEVTFLSLPTPEVMARVSREWLEGATPGSILVDLTTNSPSTVKSIGAELSAKGCHLLECPLTGGAPGAKARQLVFMVGGEASVYERCKPVLDKIGRANFHLGPLGCGNVAKLINSLFAFATTLVSLEGLAVATRAGIDLRTLIELIKAAGGGNFFLNFMVEGLNERNRPTQFALDLAAKDAGLLLDLARQAGVPTPIAGQVAQSLVAAKALGLGERDFTDLVELVERQSGLKIVVPPPR